MTEDLASATDARLVAWIIDGRTDCVRELIGRYGRALRAVLRRTLGEDPDLEDLCQESWMRVIRHAHTYDPTYAFSTWIFRIAWNLAQDRLRRRSRGGSLAADPEAMDGHADPTPAADDQFLARERDQALRDSIAALPDHLRETLMLRYFEDLSEREVAERLEVPTGTVKSRLHTAHRRLALLLGDAQ
jgi:RNA polymerase sigma-70 factor, ECF subfamily